MTAHFVNLLETLRRRADRMAGLVEDMVQEACEAAAGADETLARRVIKRDSDVDAEEVEIESEVIRLMALYQPVGSDLRLLCAILKINNDLERVADCAINIAQRARHLDPDAGTRHHAAILEMADAVQRMLRGANQAFAAEDIDAARKTFAVDDRIDARYEQIIQEIVAQGAATPEGMADRLDILSIAKNLERIADHATNIAEDVIFLSTGKIIRHADDDAPQTNE